jgi:hypothetical protein
MPRWRANLVTAAGVILVLSSVAHTFLGWRDIAPRLAGVDPKLVRGLEAGWYFGGISMLAFGLIAITIASEMRRGVTASLRTLLIVGASYTVFGLWALVTSGFDPFFFLFLGPGLMLLAGTIGAATPPRAAT